MGTEKGLFLDRTGPGPDLLVRDLRHGSDAVRPMTLLAAALQGGRDIFREGDVSGSSALLGSEGARRKETDEESDETREPEPRCSRGEGSSETHGRISILSTFYIRLNTHARG